jgi:hypothetical protein
MTKLSVNEAVKHFLVSRPTLTKALKNGDISGVKDGAKGWQIQPAELARLYSARNQNDRKDTDNIDSDLHQSLKDQINQLKDQITELKADKQTLQDQVKFFQGLLGTRLIEDKTKPKKQKQQKNGGKKKGKKKGKK